MRLAPTPRGRAVLAGALGCLVAGFALAWPAAVVAGWAALVAVVASAGRLARQGLRSPAVDVPQPVHAQEACVVRLQGQGEARWSAPAATEGDWTRLPASLPHTPAFPGVQPFPAFDLRAADRLGWWTATARMPGPEVAVLPARLELSRASREARTVAAALRGATGPGSKRDRSEAEGLRKWLEGGDIRFIDWKASSRFEDLLEKEFVRLRDADAEVVLDSTAAARRPDAPGRRSPAQVGLAATLLVVAWCRSHQGTAHVTVARDGAPARWQAKAGGAALQRLLDAMPAGLEAAAPAAPDDAGAPTPFDAILRRLRGTKVLPGLQRALRALPKGSDSALFVVSPLELSPQSVADLDREAQGYAHRVLIQVGDLERSATDAATLEATYPRAARRRRNAQLLARRGWVTVEAPADLRAADILTTVVEGARRA
jgi:uncharacterized protein (DUF58 family)